jgi:AcrR family transcriptional regulator
VPRLWTDTVADHRAAVRSATLDATGELLHTHGPYGLTMSAIAQRTGIGRATLYKYFSDVESILVAWHEREIGTHLAQLIALADAPGSPVQRLTSVLDAYAAIERRHHDHPLAATLHGGPHHLEGRRRLRSLLAGLIDAAARAGVVRDDVPVEDLAAFCINALGAAGEARGADIAGLTLDALRR